MLAALSAVVIVLCGVQAALFLDPEVPLAPASWPIISVCIWLLFVLSKGGWSQLNRHDIRRFAFGIYTAVFFLHFLQLDTHFEGWSSVYYFCGHKLQYCTCNFRWNLQGWYKAIVLWQFVLSATLGAQQLIIQAGLGGLLPGEEAVTRESFVSIGWRLIPYWLNNWEQQWGAEVSSMTFELPHFAVELLVILPCCQIICSRLKVLVTPQVNVLLGPPGPGGAEEGPVVREDFAPNVLQGFWERRPEQRRFLPRVRSNLRVLAFLTGLTALAAFNATLVPLYLEGQAAGAAATPAVALIGRNTDWLGSRVGELSAAGNTAGATGSAESGVAAGMAAAEWVTLLEVARERYGMYGARECGDREPYVRSVAKHAAELQRMQDPEHRALIPLVESALAIMRLSCEKYFVLVAIYVAFLLFRDAPRPARVVIRLVARVSGIFQRVILFAFPAVCWLYNAGLVFSLFVSVVFWGGPLLALYDTARSALREVSIRSLEPATAEQIHRMGGSCAICWGDMTAHGGHARSQQSSPAGSAVAAAAEAAAADAEAESAACVAESVSAASFNSALTDWDAAAGPPADDAAAAATAAAEPLGSGEEVQPGRRQQRRQKRREERELKQQQRRRQRYPEKVREADACCSATEHGRPSPSTSCCSGLGGRMSHSVGASTAGEACSGCDAGSFGASGAGPSGGGSPSAAGPGRSSPNGGAAAAGTAGAPPVAGRPELPGETGAKPAAAAAAGGEATTGPVDAEHPAAMEAAAAAAAAMAAEAEAKAIGWALPCGHAYHHECLLQWMEQCSSTGVTPTCPMCQRGIQLQVRWRLPHFLRRHGAGEAAAAAAVHGTARLLGLEGGAGGAAAGVAPAAAAAGGAAAVDLAAGAELLDAVRNFAGADAGLQVVGLLEHQRELQELLHEAPALEFGEMLREAQPLIVQQAQAQAQAEAEQQQLGWEGFAPAQEPWPGQGPGEGGLGLRLEPGPAAPGLVGIAQRGGGGAEDPGGPVPEREPHWLQLYEQPSESLAAGLGDVGWDCGFGGAEQLADYNQYQQQQQQQEAPVVAAGSGTDAGGGEGYSAMALAAERGMGGCGDAAEPGLTTASGGCQASTAAAAGSQDGPRTSAAAGGFSSRMGCNGSGGVAAAQPLATSTCGGASPGLSTDALDAAVSPTCPASGPSKGGIARLVDALPARDETGAACRPVSEGDSDNDPGVTDKSARGAAGPAEAAAAAPADAARSEGSDGAAEAGDCGAEPGTLSRGAGGDCTPTLWKPAGSGACDSGSQLLSEPSAMPPQQLPGRDAASGAEGAGPSEVVAAGVAAAATVAVAAAAPGAAERPHKPRRRFLFWRRKH